MYGLKPVPFKALIDSIIARPDSKSCPDRKPKHVLQRSFARSRGILSVEIS
jgi:hypothetical protein